MRRSGATEWRLTSTELRVGLVCLAVSGILIWLLLGVISDWRLVWTSRLTRELTVKPEHLAKTLIWWSVLGSSILWTVLGLTVRWWIGRLPPRSASGGDTPIPLNPVKTPSGWWWVGLALVLLIAAGLRYPRMELSLYNDEVYGFEKYVSGRFTEDKLSGDIIFKRVPWEETWWGNRLGNNFPLYSAFERWVYDSWAQATDAADGEVSEWALRSPALAGGLISIALLAIWLRGAGLSKVGLVSALVLAVHPAHIRYSTEARGYGMAFVGVILVAWLLWRAIREDRWIFWAGYGLAQVYLLLSYPGAIYWVAVLNLGVFSWLVKTSWRTQSMESDVERARQLLARWWVVNAMAAALFCIVCLPQIYQAQLAHADPNYMHAPMPGSWWLDVGAFLLLGIQWTGGETNLPHMPALSHWHWALAAIALGLPILAWTGMILRNRDRGMIWWILMVSVPTSVALAWVHNASRGVFMHHWYAVHLVPLIALFTVTSWAASTSNSDDPGRTRFGSLPQIWQGIGIFFLAGWLVVALMHWRIIGYNSKEPLRSVIEITRGGVYPDYLGGEHPKIFLGGFFSNANTYDPHFVVIKGLEDLEKLVEQAKSQKLPLFVTHGYLEQASQAYPELIEILHHTDRFRLVKRFDGLGGNQFAHFVLEWVGD